MTRIVVHASVLFSLIFFSTAFAQPPDARPGPQDATPISSEPPINIRVDEVLRPLVSELLAKSQTFRRQWHIITAARLIRVTVVSRLGMQDGSTRARTELTRYEHGAIRAIIELPGATDLTELLPHEFEHVIEQLEGIDLRAWAERGRDGVVEIRKGVFETVRARAAGLQVYREVYGDTDPAVGSAFGRVRRAWRALGSRPGPETAAKTQEQPPRRRRGGAVEPAPHLHKRW